MVKRRQGNVPDLQNQISNDAARQAQMQAAQQRQHQLMLSQMAARGMGQPPQPGFQPMQNPMQIPGMPQQPQQMPMGMANPGMLQTRPDQRQFQMQMPQARPPPVFQLDPLSQLNPQDKVRVNDLAAKLMARAEEHHKTQIRHLMQQKLSPAQNQECMAQGKDPVFAWFQNTALSQLQQQQAKVAAQHRNAMQQRPGMPPNMMPHTPHQGQMNPALMGTLARQGAMPDSQTFTPTMESIRNDQHMGRLAQQAGQMVVPASTAPGRNATPGPMAGIPPQPTPGNQQGPNQTPRPPQVPQAFGMPQVKMDPTASQIQGQPGVRAVGGQAMPGQPGAIATPNGGPQPSQSPAMNTLNAPMRRPPVPMGQGNGQPMNQGNQAMGATLNPQFNHQNNTRPPSIQGAMNNPAALAGMVPNVNSDGRAGMGVLAENGAMREFYAKLQQEQQRAANNGFQGPKPGLMPGMPGHLQAGPMGGPNQAAMANANQKGNGPMQSTPQPPPMQQQSATEREHIMSIAQSAQGRIAMNSMDVPPQLMGRLRGSIQLPADIQKWGQLRQFLQNNPGLMPANMQGMLNNWQLMQFKAILDKKKGPTASASGPQPPNGPVPQQQGSASPALPPGFSYPPNLSHVARQDVEAARQKDVRFQVMPDEVLMDMIRRHRRDTFARRAWEQFQQHQQAQGNNNTNNPIAGIQKAGVPVPQTSTSQQGGITAAPHPNAPQGVQQQAAQPKPAGAPVMEGAPTPASGTSKHTRPAPQPSPAPAPKNLKRPNPDDANDVSVQPSNAVQRPVSQSGARPPPAAPKPSVENLMKLSADQIAKISPEQMAKLTPEQRAIVMRNRAGPAGGQETVARLRELAGEAHRLAAQEALQQPEMPTPAAEAQETRLKLGLAAEKIKQLRGASNIAKWYHLTKDDSRARMFFKTVCGVLVFLS